MNFKKIASGALMAGAIGLSAVALGSGTAQADKHGPCPGPGVNCIWPGNPLPPGQGFLPPPGHRGDFVPDDWNEFVPDWAPPRPVVPDWAPGASVVWNADIGSWGIWWNGGFVRL